VLIINPAPTVEPDRTQTIYE